MVTGIDVSESKLLCLAFSMLFTSEEEGQIAESCQINDLPWTIHHAYEGCRGLQGLVFLWQDGSGNETVSQKP